MRLLAHLRKRYARLRVSHPKDIPHAAVLFDEIVTTGTAAKGGTEDQEKDRETNHSVSLSNIEQEVAHIGILHDVVLALDA
jgi:hypothetical protein